MTTKLRLITGVAIATMAFSARAELSVDTTKISQQLGSVPRPELAPKAANLVLTAQGANREQYAEAVVGAAVDINPDAAASIVSSVCKLSPDLAPATAVAASAKLPKQTRAIVRAAAGAAPSQALKIVQAMCKSRPGEFGVIAVGVADAVPKMDRTIINAVVEAVPTLKPFYLRAAQALATENDGIPVVALYMEQMSRDITQSAQTLKTTEQTLVNSGVTLAQQSALPLPPAPTTPTVRPAFQPLPGSPSEINRDQTVVIPPTGTRYSSP